MVNPKDKEEDKGKSSSVPNSVVKRVNDNVDSRVHRHRRSEWKRRWRPYSGRRFSRSFGKNSRLDDLESRKAKWLNLRMHVLGQPLAPYNTTQFLMDDHHVREPEFGQIDRLLQVNATVAAVAVVSVSPSNTTSTNTTSVSTTNPLIINNNNSLNNNNNNNNYNRENNNFDGNQSTTNETKSPHYGGNGGGHRRRCMSDSTPSRKNSEDASSDDFYSSPDDEQDFIQRQFFETYENIHAERISTMSKAELVKEYFLLEQRCEELESKLKQMEYSVGLKT
ncbi:protein HEXIM1-like [Panonychus citri]|uniref:protein HEXIM1-like n=1 Tax=Panonychus citri TaxID=50023 RepID=UPI00230792ED|nr:protein HEXIM1-like [Panonychus citri]